MKISLRFENDRMALHLTSETEAEAHILKLWSRDDCKCNVQRRELSRDNIFVTSAHDQYQSHTMAILTVTQEQL